MTGKCGNGQYITEKGNKVQKMTGKCGNGQNSAKMAFKCREGQASAEKGNKVQPNTVHDSNQIFTMYLAVINSK